VPPDTKHTEALARRVCFIRESHFGGFWDFTANLAHGDTAYTNLAIGAHTDSTYFTDPVGLQLFHLLKHDGEGGHTLLVDGFHIANELRTNYPDYFKTLSTLRIATHSAGDKDIIIRPTPSVGFPIIQCDPVSGEVYQVRFNNHDRSALSGKVFSKDEIEAFYASLRKWTELVRDPKNELWLKMQPGRAVIVDNWRVMHGRSSFTGYRRLCGAYLNWDDYRSRVSMIVDQGRIKDQL
jgi:trimethyllysine dioxygenase